MTNYKTTDLKFFKSMFNEYEKIKKNIITDNNNIYGNLNFVTDIWARKYNFELRNKIAFIKLNTDNFESKKIFIDKNFYFNEKYTMMYKKSNYLGPEPDQNFNKKIKKIGDISFDEEDNDLEHIRNLKRLSPDNVTEEWIKENLNNTVEILRLDNCYWLSKELVSKIGRIDTNIKVFNLIFYN